MLPNLKGLYTCFLHWTILGNSSNFTLLNIHYAPSADSALVYDMLLLVSLNGRRCLNSIWFPFVNFNNCCFVLLTFRSNNCPRLNTHSEVFQILPFNWAENMSIRFEYASFHKVKRRVFESETHLRFILFQNLSAHFRHTIYRYRKYMLQFGHSVTTTKEI